MEKTNMFNTAVKKKAASDKDAKQVVTIPGISPQLKRIVELRRIAKANEAEQKMLEGEIKGLLREKYLDVYQANAAHPDSFKIAGDQGGEMLLVIMDKYIKCTEEKVTALEKYPGIVHTVKKFSFDPEILERVGDKIAGPISEAIQNADISADDKANLLVVEEQSVVKKGTIKRLFTFPQPRELFYLIEPIVMLK